MQDKISGFFLFCLMLISCAVHAQGLGGWMKDTFTKDRLDYSIHAGMSSYIGELNTAIMKPSMSDINVGGTVRYTFNRNKIDIPTRSFSARLDVNYLGISGEGKEVNIDPALAQNLQFSNKIYEVFGAGEFNFFNFRPNRVKKSWTPYVFAGIGLAYHNPTSLIGNTQFDPIKEEIEFKKLAYKPNSSENQSGSDPQVVDEMESVAYKKTAVILPFGAGLKWYINHGFSVGLEMNYRYAFNDFLDGVGAGQYHAYPVPYDPKDATEWNNNRIQWEQKASPSFGGTAGYTDLVNQETLRGKKGNDFYMTTVLKFTIHIFNERDPLW